MNVSDSAHTTMQALIRGSEQALHLLRYKPISFHPAEIKWKQFIKGREMYVHRSTTLHMFYRPLFFFQKSACKKKAPWQKSIRNNCILWSPSHKPYNVATAVMSCLIWGPYVYPKSRARTYEQSCIPHQSINELRQQARKKIICCTHQ